MTAVDAFLTNCRLTDSRLVDIRIVDGRSRWPAKARCPAMSNSAPALDIGGDLALPGWSAATCRPTSV
jgi:hypothetical protein